MFVVFAAQNPLETKKISAGIVRGPEVWACPRYMRL